MSESMPKPSAATKHTISAEQIEASADAATRDWAERQIDSAATVDLPTLGEIEPAAVRCWERIRAVLPPSDPTDPDDPSVNLDTLMAILYCALTRESA